jgi:hypothetical protein
VPSTRFLGKKLQPPIPEHFKDQSPKGWAEEGRSPKFHSLGHKRMDASIPEFFQYLMCPKNATPGSKKWGDLGQEY